MSDQIHLHGMVFDGHVGVPDEERAVAQPIEVDVELMLDLSPAGTSDDLAATVDYGLVYAACRELVESRSFHLLEAVAESLAAELLRRFAPVEALVVHARKPGVPIDGEIEHAGVCIERRRSG
jgi:dihydroneopterin aldolase